MILCADTPIPSFESIWNKIKGEITFPPNINFDFTIPPLPSLPNPIFPDISHFALELSNIAQELQSFQFLQTLYQFIKPLADVIGGAIEALIPDIPLLNLNLIDLLALDPTKLYENLRKAILQIQFPDIDFTIPDFTFPTFSLPTIPIPEFPTLPIPMFGTLSIPSIELVNTVKLILKDYMNTLMNIIPNLVNQVVGILALVGIPTLQVPQLPTLDEIKAQIAALVQWPDFNITLPEFPPLDFLQGFSISELLSQITVPGFPSFTIPDPLFPNYSSLEHELIEGLNILYQQMIAYPMQQIMNFLNQFLSILGFSFPTLCIPL